MRPVLYRNDTAKIEALKDELRKFHGEDIGIHEDSDQEIWLIQFIGKGILRRGQTVSAAMTVLIEDNHENYVKVAVGMARWNLKADNKAMSSIGSAILNWTEKIRSCKIKGLEERGRIT